jgi:hypothetical protein
VVGARDEACQAAGRKVPLLIKLGSLDALGSVETTVLTLAKMGGRALSLHLRELFWLRFTYELVCHACSCQEILRTDTACGVPGCEGVVGLNTQKDYESFFDAMPPSDVRARSLGTEPPSGTLPERSLLALPPRRAADADDMESPQQPRTGGVRHTSLQSSTKLHQN